MPTPTAQLSSGWCQPWLAYTEQRLTATNAAFDPPAYPGRTDPAVSAAQSSSSAQPSVAGAAVALFDDGADRGAGLWVSVPAGLLGRRGDGRSVSHLPCRWRRRTLTRARQARSAAQLTLSS
jgi:hypothetical protein